MGFFGGDNEADNSNTLIEDQLNANRAELESKRRSLVEQRLAIEKSQGGAMWTGGRNSYLPTSPSPQGGKGWRPLTRNQ